VNPLPTITASASPSAICVGFSSTISAAGGDTYIWSNSNTGSSFSESPMATTIYQVTGTDVNGCTGTADVTLTVMPGLTINITPAMDEICEGDNSTLTASSPATGVTYNWDNGMNTNPITISPANTTTYTVTGTDAQGCSGTTSAIVTVNPLPTAQFSADPTQGCLPLNVQFDDQSTGNIAFWAWDFGDGNNSGIQNPSHTYNTAGVFDVELTVTTDKGCTGTLLIPAYINAAAIPTASFIANPDIASEDNPTIQFIDQSIGATSWFWNFSDPNSSDPTSIQQNPMHTFTSSGEFLVTLTVSNDAECLDSTSGIVVIKPTFTFYIPNTFTPNADGKNEVFKPFGMGWDTDNYEMRIYNRWGELVFATTDINHGWNGTGPKGEDVPNGVYTAKIVVMELSGMEHYYDTKVNVIR
jgi:gliding motility-associated-like protein